MVVSFAAASNTSVWQAFGTVAGWVALWMLRRTVGQPICPIWWAACQMAGVNWLSVNGFWQFCKEDYALSPLIWRQLAYRGQKCTHRPNGSGEIITTASGTLTWAIAYSDLMQ